jgi:hypothetical protein
MPFFLPSTEACAKIISREPRFAAALRSKLSQELVRQSSHQDLSLDLRRPRRRAWYKQCLCHFTGKSAHESDSHFRSPPFHREALGAGRAKEKYEKIIHAVQRYREPKRLKKCAETAGRPDARPDLRLRARLALYCHYKKDQLER